MHFTQVNRQDYLNFRIADWFDSLALVLFIVEQNIPVSDVVIVGQGYVGLPLAMAALGAGHSVTGIDTDFRRVERIRAGFSPIADISHATISAALKGGRYHPISDYSLAHPFQTAVITVPTPLVNGDPDLRFIKAAGASLGPLVTEGCLVVLESTTYPGTTEELLVPELEITSGLRAGEDFHVGYSPERIDPGNPKWSLENTPKVISGINSASLAKVDSFYRSLGIKTVPVSGTREAEMTKLLENTFRHVNIALVNELAMFSDHLGVDIWEAIEAADTKPFGFMKFTPGPGVGGHCLPVDPSYLSWAIKNKTGNPFRFVELANKVNDYMPHFVAQRALNLLGEIEVERQLARILIIGLAYKPLTSDIRESPALAIARILSDDGADVYGLDKYISDFDWPGFIKRHKEDDIKYDLGILVTSHSRELSVHAIEMCHLVLDTRNSVGGPNVRQL